MFCCLIYVKILQKRQSTGFSNSNSRHFLVIIFKTKGHFLISIFIKASFLRLSQSPPFLSQFFIPFLSVSFGVNLFLEKEELWQLAWENAAKSATSSGLDNCYAGGAIRPVFQLIAFLQMYRLDTWRSASVAVAGDLWCALHT